MFCWLRGTELNASVTKFSSKRRFSAISLRHGGQDATEFSDLLNGSRRQPQAGGVRSWSRPSPSEKAHPYLCLEVLQKFHILKFEYHALDMDEGAPLLHLLEPIDSRPAAHHRLPHVRMGRTQRPSLRTCEGVKRAHMQSRASVVNADERKGGSVSRERRIGFATIRAVTIRWHRTLCHGSTEAAANDRFFRRAVTEIDQIQALQARAGNK